MTEVQQSLPHQAYQFALIDKQWRELMFNTSRNPNVMQLCCKAGEYILLWKIIFEHRPSTYIHGTTCT